MNSSKLLARNARKYPDTFAVKSEYGHLTYLELDEQVNQLSHALLARGIKQADKVILFMPNVPEFVISYFAIQRIGALVAPINAKLTMPEIHYILDHSNASAIIAHDLIFDTVRELDADILKIKTGKGNKDWESFHEITSKASPNEVECLLTESDLSTLLYTSGTTGKPKGVLFNYRNIFTVAQMVCVEMEVKPESRILLMMPLSHSAPLHLFLMAGVIVGSTLVLRVTFTPSLLIEAVESEQTTHFFGAPVAYLLTAKTLVNREVDLSSMLWWIYGGAPISTGEVEFIKKQFKTDNLISVYGLTEAGPSGSILLAEEHDAKAGSIGKRAPLHTELKIADQDGNDIAVNEVGEILIKGPGNMVGYYQNEQATKETFINGWLKTGDLARYDEDGYIWVVDRMKDMIISGGVNIYPLEIENVLINHPDIQEVAIVGLKHKYWGEIPMAFYVTETDINPKDLKLFSKDKLASYKIPKIFEKVDILPRNATGKVLKHELKKLVESR